MKYIKLGFLPLFYTLILLVFVSQIQAQNLKTKLANRGNKVMICAHRSQWQNNPENSLSSVTAAINDGIPMIEIDVRTTCDGILMIMHDDRIDRTTNGQGFIKQKTFDELRRYKLYNGNTLTNETIPTLEEMLDASKGKVFINLDVKDANEVDIYNLVVSKGMINEVLFFAPHTQKMNLVNNYPSAIVMPYISDYDSYTWHTSSISNPVVYHYGSNATQAMYDAAANDGISIYDNAYILNSGTPSGDNYETANTLINKDIGIIATDYSTNLIQHLINNSLYLTY